MAPPNEEKDLFSITRKIRSGHAIHKHAYCTQSYHDPRVLKIEYNDDPQPMMRNGNVRRTENDNTSFSAKRLKRNDSLILCFKHVLGTRKKINK